MSDVKTLIASLTAERNAIDRAIAGLQQMSEIRSHAAVATPKAKRQQGHREPWKRKPRIRLDDATKARIVERMAAAENRSEMARELSQELGSPFATIQSGWQRWQKQISNGNVANVQ